MVVSRVDDILMSKKPCKAQVEVLKEGTSSTTRRYQ
jgi:hypothetical protein